MEFTSIADAEYEAEELLQTIRQIEEQLGDRNRVDPETGERLRGDDYHRWRQKASHARRKSVEQYREIKKWIKARNKEINEVRNLEGAAFDFEDPDDLLEASLSALRLFARATPPNEHQQLVIDALRRYIKERKTERCGNE